MDAHVHGEAELNIVFEGRELLMELESPSFNLVGFEHEPKSLDQHKLVENTIESLKDFNRLLVFQADCKLIEASISTTMKGLSDGRKKHHEDEHHEDEHHEDEHHEDEHHEDEHHEDEHQHHEDEHHEDEHHEDEHHEHLTNIMTNIMRTNIITKTFSKRNSLRILCDLLPQM